MDAVYIQTERPRYSTVLAYLRVLNLVHLLAYVMRMRTDLVIWMF